MGSADCGDWVEHLSTSLVLQNATLFILNNAIFKLHENLKRVPEKKLRNTDVEKFDLALPCDYKSTIVAHQTHQISPS